MVKSLGIRLGTEACSWAKSFIDRWWNHHPPSVSSLGADLIQLLLERLAQVLEVGLGCDLDGLLQVLASSLGVTAGRSHTGERVVDRGHLGQVIDRLGRFQRALQGDLGVRWIASAQLREALEVEQLTNHGMVAGKRTDALLGMLEVGECLGGLVLKEGEEAYLVEVHGKHVLELQLL